VANHILAVHLAGDQLAFAVAESTLRSMTVTALGRVAANSDAIADIVDEHDWDRVIASLPAEAAVFRTLEFPFHDRRKLTLAVGPALEEHVPLSLDECKASFDLIGGARRGEVLAAMAADTTIHSHLEALAVRGVVPERLIWAPSATLEVYRRAAGEDESFTAVDVGDDAAVIACFDEGRLHGLRVVRGAEQDVFIRNVAWSLRTLDPPAGRVIAGGAQAMELTAPLAEALAGMNIEQLPFDCPVPLAEGAAPGWRGSATALGLVLAAGGDLAAPVVEFALPGYDDAGIGELREQARTLAPWAVATAAALLVAGGLDYARLRQHTDQLEGHASSVFSSAMPGDADGPGLRIKMELRLAELERRQAELTGSGGYARPLAVLAEMSRSVPKQLAIEFDTYTYDPPSVRLRGHGASFEAVTRLQQVLEASRSFGDVSVSDVRSAATGDGVVFELSVQLGADGQSA